MGNDALKVIAHELLTGLKGNVTVDWSHRESARARMRVLVKRILRKYGYPPDLPSLAKFAVLSVALVLYRRIPPSRQMHDDRGSRQCETDAASTRRDQHHIET